MYWIVLIVLVSATVYDLRAREIPDWLSVALLGAAVIWKLLGVHSISWVELGMGAGAAFAVSAFLFSRGGLGGGDVKLLTAIGAALGAQALLPFAMLTAVFGGCAALIARRRREVEIPYAPVMLAGLLGLFPLVWLAR